MAPAPSAPSAPPADRPSGTLNINSIPHEEVLQLASQLREVISSFRREIANLMESLANVNPGTQSLLLYRSTVQRVLVLKSTLATFKAEYEKLLPYIDYYTIGKNASDENIDVKTHTSALQTPKEQPQQQPQQPQQPAGQDSFPQSHDSLDLANFDMSMGYTMDTSGSMNKPIVL